MKSKDKPNNNKDKEKKIIPWEVKSFPAVEINNPEIKHLPKIQKKLMQKKEEMIRIMKRLVKDIKERKERDMNRK